ncbi:hypothetical protein PFISCL1PPCAC_14162, partial [Pristionchus fissidentatus]
SLCPNGTLTLGFASEFFPYFYQQNGGEFNGIVAALFQTIGRRFHCGRGVEYRKFPKLHDQPGSEVYNGALDRGEVLTAIESSWLRDQDMVFVEARDIRVDKITSLSFYVVFPIDFIAILFV